MTNLRVRGYRMNGRNRIETNDTTKSWSVKGKRPSTNPGDPRRGTLVPIDGRPF